MQVPSAPDDPSPQTPTRGTLDAAELPLSVPQSARLPGVSVTDIRLPWAPSPPQTPPLYRAFKGNSFASSLKADDPELLSQGNGAVLAFTRPDPRTSVDLAVQQSERSSGKQLSNLITPDTSGVRSGRFGPGSVSVFRTLPFLRLTGTEFGIGVRSRDLGRWLGRGTPRVSSTY